MINHISFEEVLDGRSYFAGTANQVFSTFRKPDVKKGVSLKAFQDALVSTGLYSRLDLLLLQRSAIDLEQRAKQSATGGAAVLSQSQWLANLTKTPEGIEFIVAFGGDEPRIKTAYLTAREAAGKVEKTIDHTVSKPEYDKLKEKAKERTAEIKALYPKAE